MNDLLEVMLFVLGLFTAMSALLYVLATIDPRTDKPQPSSVNVRT